MNAARACRRHQAILSPKVRGWRTEGYARGAETFRGKLPLNAAVEFEGVRMVIGRHKVAFMQIYGTG